MGNNFLIIYKYLYVLLLFCCFSVSYAHKYEFNDLVVFGDSLSDMGNLSNIGVTGIENSKVVAGNSLTYNEYLSKIFTGQEIYPASKGGTNYAISNAIVNSLATNSLIRVFDDYFANNHKIIPDNLYIIWGGGNDLASYLITNNLINILPDFTLYSIYNSINRVFNSKTEFIDLFNPFKYDFLDSTIYTAALISRMSYKLIYYGAKYVMVPNLFDLGLVPEFLFPFKYLAQVIIPLPLLISQSYYDSLNQQNNTPGNNYPGAGREFIMNNLYTQLTKKYGLIGKLIYKASQVLTISTKQFNFVLDKALQQLSDNIVYIDIYQLFNEIIDNPKFYGIDDIILPTCRTIFSNDYRCKDKESGVYHSEKRYIFSDVIHPSGFMHLIYSQYMASVFNAPVKVSSILRQLANFNNNGQDYLFNQLVNLNHYDTTNKTLPFVSISGEIAKIGFPYNYNRKNTYTNSLILGITNRINSKLLVGLMLDASFGNYEPYDDFKYRYNSQIVKLFSKYNINDNWWLSGSINTSRIGANNIRRVIQLGEGKHIEKGSTNGRSLGLNLTSAYDFKYNDNIRLTPYISLSLDNYKINSFQEQNNRSTSMRYGKNSTTAKQIKVAVRLSEENTEFLNGFIELGITNPIDNQAIKIKSGLKSTQASFIREIYYNEKFSANLAMGFSKQFINNLFFNANLNYKINKNNDKQFYYSLGINKKF